MFEKYDIDKLYIGEIEGWIPWSIENIGGNISITGDDVGVYQTIIYEDNGKYIDIYHLDRIICDISKGNINTCCSLPYSTFLINNCNNLSHLYSPLFPTKYIVSNFFLKIKKKNDKKMTFSKN